MLRSLKGFPAAADKPTIPRPTHAARHRLARLQLLKPLLGACAPLGMQRTAPQDKCSDSVRLQQLTDAAVEAAEAGDFAAAAAQFSRALQLHPDSATLHEQHAQCLMELDDYTAAVTAAEAATALQPEWPEGWVTLARCYLNNGQLQSAHQAYCRSLVLCPDQPDVQLELSNVVQLCNQQISRLVGLPDLAITADPAGQLGPGCVIWEAGIQLAKLLVANNGHSCQNRCQQEQEADRSRIAAAESSPFAAATEPGAASNALPSLCCLPGTAGARVLEVGSGTGVVGITAAALGAHVTLTDLPELLPLLRSNIAASLGVVDAAGGSAAAAVLDWNTLGGSSSNSRSEGRDLLHEHWDWCMGADLVFNARQVKPVVQLISASLQQQRSQQDSSQGGAMAKGDKPEPCAGFLLAHKHRHQQLDEQLLQELQLAGLQVQIVANSGQQHERDWQQQQQQQQQQKPPPVSTSPTCLQVCTAAQDCCGVGVWWITSSTAGVSAAACTHVDTTRHVAYKDAGDRHIGQQQQLQQEGQQQGADSQQAASCAAPAHQQQPQQQQQQQRQQLAAVEQCVLPDKKLLLLSAGLAGVGKSTILRQLTGKLARSVYLDKDTFNAALLRGQPYFSDYYKQHVQEQTYAAMFGIAADNLAAREQCVVILDGQFGDKLSAGYVQPLWRAIQQGLPLNFAQHQEKGVGINKHQPDSNDAEAVAQQQQGQATQTQQVASGASLCRVALLLFECCADLQLQRLHDRGLSRDMEKYACFEESGSREVQLIEQQVLLVGGQLDGVLRVDTSRDAEACVDDIICQLGSLLVHDS